MRLHTDGPADDTEKPTADVGAAERIAELEAELAKLRSVGAATILSQLAEGVIITDAEGRITFVNEAAERLHGTAQLGVGPDGYSSAYQLFTEDGRPYPPSELPLARAVLNNEIVEGAHWRIRRSDGAEVLAIGSARPMIGDDGSRIGAVLTLRDDTERSRTESALRASEEFSRRVLASSPDCIKVLSLEGRLEFMTEGGMFVMEVDEFADIEGVHWPEIWEEEEALKAAAALQEARSGATARFQGFARTFKGSGRWWDVTLSPINNSSGRPEKLLSVSRDITQIKEAEAVLRKSEERLRQTSRRLDAILANTRMAVFLMDERQQCTYANAAAEALTGYTFAELRGRPLHDVIHHKKPDGSHYPLHECPIDRAFPERAQTSGEELFVAPDGSFYPVAFTASPVSDDEGQPIGTVIEARNIAEEKARDAALRESEARFRLMADAVPQIVWITDADGHLEFFNKQWFDYVGSPDIPLSAAEVAKQHLHPEDEAASRAAFEAASRGGTTYVVEHRIRSAQGEYRWFLARGEPYRDAETGQIVRWFGASVDIHDRKLAEEALRQSEARLAFLDGLGAETAPLADADAVLATTTRLLGEHLKLAICAYADMDDDQDGFTIRGDWAAPGSASIVGHYSLADFGKLAVKNLSAGLPLVVNDNVQELAPEEAATFQGIGIAATICMPLIKEGRLTALMAIHDRVPRVWTEAELSLLREVTARSWAHVERVAAVAELRASDARLRNLNDTLEQQVVERSAALRLYENIVQSDQSPVCAFDQDYRLIAFNRAHSDEFFRIFSHRVQIGEVFPDLFPPDQRAIIREFMARALTGESFTIIEEFGDPSLAKPYWEVSYYPLKDEAGRIIGAFHHAKDVSERLRTQAQLTAAQEALRQSQKLEAIGQLTGGVAHDFNNLLTVIRGSADILKRADLSEERRRRYVDAIAETSDRAAKLTSQLLAFARRQALNPTEFNVLERLTGIREMLATLVGSRIKLEIQANPSCCHVRADASQFETAIVNMVVNARDAMSGEGVITIAVETADAIPPVRGHEKQEGQFVAIFISDTGSGIPPDQLDRIFEPFFTTKDVGQGTGLGLSQVFGFAKQSAGEILVQSKQGSGTTFKLYLPWVESPTETETSLSEERERPRLGRGRVLIVEDNSQVGDFASQLIQDFGYQTTWLSGGQAALEYLASGQERVDVVFSDVVMPGMSGVDLAKEISRRFPSLPVILTSGYSHVLAQEGSCGFTLIHKPYSADALAQALEKAFAGNGAGAPS